MFGEMSMHKFFMTLAKMSKGRDYVNKIALLFTYLVDIRLSSNTLGISLFKQLPITINGIYYSFHHFPY